ncbi:MAG: 30S ribosomal protein S13 [Candidatus Andersenbacteria bacterium CG10_big_fil_rev_8_21_14_0_10_54_11]|uniref:Small ribosomal subunit protein uS13 n=1 Tax=Candidatus Andersenbacteria bacterium CG10_big_fil_rev_8_21_14_0_10_54_11 TaxID=1974485 RepID=A0A2M6WYI1_9BACT|nr:MAG: 30S ribosomal protein S13 [Candidatus Andersenbacteria bacterium CG10_big_fil_rev_8_21_14_0_10_54_11]
MPLRISGVNLPDRKRITVALTAIYGIGPSLAARVLGELSISPDVRTGELTGQEEKSLRDYIEEHMKVEGDLRRDVAQHIKHLKDINSYRGTRHTRHLPVHGQRTRTNSRTVRGNVRRPAGSGRKSSSEKT